MENKIFDLHYPWSSNRPTDVRLSVKEIAGIFFAMVKMHALQAG